MSRAKKVFTKGFAVVLAIIIMLMSFPLTTLAAQSDTALSGAASFPNTLYATSTSAFGAHDIKLNDGKGNYYQAFCCAASKSTPGGNRTYTKERALNSGNQKDAVILRALYYGYGGKGYADHNTTKWVIQWAETGDYYSYNANFFKLCGVKRNSSGKLQCMSNDELKKTTVTINGKKIKPIIDGSELMVTPSKATLSTSNTHIESDNSWRQTSEEVTLKGSGNVKITVPSGYHFVYNGTRYDAGTHTVTAGYKGHIWCGTSTAGTATITGTYTKDIFEGAIYKSSNTGYQPLASRVAALKTETAKFSFKAVFNASILLQLNKVSANADLTDGNGCYSLNNAVYNIYDSKSKADAAKNSIAIGKKSEADKTRFGYIVTNDKGFGKYGKGENGVPVTQRTYYAVERDASKGYLLDSTVYEFKDSGKTAGGVAVYKLYDPNTKAFEVKEKPDSDPVAVLLKKISARTGEAGDKLAGAQYTIKYYSGTYYTKDELSGIQPNATWYFRTDQYGLVNFDEFHLDPDVKSSEFYYKVENNIYQPVIPIGTVTIQEMKAPEGFLINDELFITQITGSGGNSTSQYNYPIFEEPEPYLDTKAVSADTNASTAIISKSSVITDTVMYSGLKKGDTYTVDGQLINKKTGEVISTAKKTFTADTGGEGVVGLSYTFDSAGLANNSVVAFAFLKDSSGKLLYSHNDINDSDQTVSFKESTDINIITNAEDIYFSSNSCFVDISNPDGSLAAISDNVTYSGLTAGVRYELHTQIIDISSGKDKAEPIEFIINYGTGAAQRLTELTTAFTAPSGGSGSITTQTCYYNIPYDGSSDKEYKYVVTQRITKANNVQILDENGNVVSGSLHQDLNDNNQTLTYRAVKTDTNAYGYKTKTKNTYTAEAWVADDVTFEGLVPGRQYTVYPYAVEKSSNTILENTAVFLSAAGKTEKVIDFADAFYGYTFTATSSNTKLKLIFDLSEYASSLAGKKVVICENIEAADINKDFFILASHADINDEDQTVSFIKPTVKTTAEVPYTGGKYAYAVSNVTITDNVIMTGLIPNAAYTVKGYVADKETGARVSDTISKTFTATGESENINVEFTVNASDYAGKSLVVCEELIYKSKTIVSHVNLNDVNQTVTVLNPTVKTKARGTTTPDEKTSIVDTVTMTGLIPGKEYTIDGQLIDKSTGSAIELLTAESGEGSFLLSDDKQTVSVTFTANFETQSVNITFSLNSRPYAGKEVVVFETLKFGADAVAMHTDLSDTDQTIKYEDRGSMYLRKYDTYTGENLVGAKFNLYAVNDDGTTVLMENCFVAPNNGRIGEYYYSETGSMTDLEPFRYIPGLDFSEESYGTMEVKRLPSGKYLLVEKSAPSGYMIDISDGVTFEISSGETTQLEIGNSPTLTTVEFIKTDDTDSPIQLSGVGFTLYSDKACAVTAKNFYKNEIGELFSDDNGLVTVDQIKYSDKDNTSYYLKETTAPPGYAPLDYIIRLNIDTEGQVTYYRLAENSESQITETIVRKTDGGDVETTRIINERLGNIKFIKTDEYSNPLEGVTFEIYTDESCTNTAGDYADKVFDPITTDSSGIVEFKNLLYGTYYIAETQTVNGKQLLTGVITANVTKDGTSLTYNGKELEMKEIVGSNEQIPVVENVEIPELPRTGGVGVWSTTAVALLLLSAGGTVMFNKRKKFPVKLN